MNRGRRADSPALLVAQNLFRSDVLVTFHKPIFVSARTHPDLIAPSAPSTPSPTPSAHERAIRTLTASIGFSIRSGILDAPSWSVIRLANTCRRLYAPLGTKLSLGDHVRLTQRFVDALMGKRAERTWEELVGVQGGGGSGDEARTLTATPTREKRPDVTRTLTEEVLKTPLVEKGKKDGAQGGYFAISPPPLSSRNGRDGGKTDDEADDEELEQLRKDLKTYQVRLARVDSGPLSLRALVDATLSRRTCYTCMGSRVRGLKRCLVPRELTDDLAAVGPNRRPRPQPSAAPPPHAPQAHRRPAVWLALPLCGLDPRTVPVAADPARGQEGERQVDTQGAGL